MKPQKAASRSASPPPVPLLARVVAGLCGALLGLALLKFVNPPIMEKFVDRPANVFEWLLNTWPIASGHGLVLVVALAGGFAARAPLGLPKWLVWMPAVWLAWEFVAATQSVAVELSNPTLVHFAACVIFFYLGLLVVSRVPGGGAFWAGIMVAFFMVLGVGFQQRFGGLEESRQYMLTYFFPAHPEMPQDVVEGLTKKMSTHRIFSTLFYPNTLAGVILMLLPLSLGVIWSAEKRFTAGARVFLMALFGLGSAACLVWSGSKGGWLLMLVLAMVATRFLPMKRQAKIAIVAAVLTLGLAGFVAKYLGFFQKGATSVVARYDYWRAAVETFNEKPVFGTGPGTFARAYEKRKRPESEMARMTHNDYLEQASDSGLAGFGSFAVMIGGTLVYSYRQGRLREDWVRLGVWLGLLGWALQSFVEFGLYIPAVAWTAFALMGWLLGQCANGMDNPPAVAKVPTA